MQVRLKLKPVILLLVLYFLYLLILTMKPFEFSVSWENRFELLEGFYNFNILDFTLNMFLFIPFGFLVFSLMKNTFGKDYVRILVCGVLGFGLSFIVETYQLFLPRDPGLADVCFNAAGSVIGAGLAKLYRDKIFAITRRSWNRIQSSRPLLVLIVILYSAAFLSLSLLSIEDADFSNWNPGFTFKIKTRVNLDRPWIGRVYLIAIYNRSLSDEEVCANFRAGPYPGNSARIKDGLVAFYTFSEGVGRTVHDKAGFFDQPLNLTINNTSKVRWLTPNGLEILRNITIKGKMPAEKLYRFIKSADKTTVEVWIAPGSSDQEDPDRIVSFSKDPYLRNLILGKDNKNIQIRLITPLSEFNGVNIDLRTYDGFLTTEIQHLVVTDTRGVQKFFVNGVEHSRRDRLDGADRLNAFFGSNLVSKAAFCFFFFFPLSFLSYTLLLNYFSKPVSAIFSAFLCFVLLVIIEPFHVVLLHQGFDVTLVALVIPVSIMIAFLAEFVKTQMTP